jgi:hypothetical protein
MKNGFRQPPAPSKKAAMQQMTQMVENMQMATRILQMSMQQLAQSYQRMDNDVANMFGVLNDLQYRTLAMMELSGVDKDKLNEIATTLKTKDYDAASDKEDKDKGYEVADAVEPTSVLIITSECPEDPSAAIFRSKFKLDESGNAEVIAALPGKKVGDKAELNVRGKKHVIEILAIRKVPAPAAEVLAAPVVEKVEANVVS